MTTATLPKPELPAVVRRCAEALRRVAEYRLPPALDRRLRELGERKEFLDAAEHDHLMELVAFTQDRTAEKLRAELALNELRALFPDEVGV